MFSLKKFLFLIFPIALAGCGHESVGQKFAFDDSKGYALLAYDIAFIGDPFPNFSFYLFPYDAATGTINRKTRVEMGCGFLCARGNEEVRFFLKPIKPGTYIVGYFYYQIDFDRTLLCFSEQSVKISPEAGTVLYLGELTISKDHPNGLVMDKLKIKAHDVAHVRARLAKYPNILEVDALYGPDGKMRAVRNTADPGEIMVAPVDYVAFERGELKRDDVCIWDYAT